MQLHIGLKIDEHARGPATAAHAGTIRSMSSEHDCYKSSFDAVWRCRSDFVIENYRRAQQAGPNLQRRPRLAGVLKPFAFEAWSGPP